MNCIENACSFLKTAISNRHHPLLTIQALRNAALEKCDNLPQKSFNALVLSMHAPSYTRLPQSSWWTNTLLNRVLKIPLPFVWCRPTWFQLLSFFLCFVFFLLFFKECNFFFSYWDQCYNKQCMNQYRPIYTLCSILRSEVPKPNMLILISVMARHLLPLLLIMHLHFSLYRVEWE